MSNYKYDLVLFCKSYRGDFERACTLKKSIDKHNADNLPFIMVVPASDYDMFARLCTGTESYDFTIITDEDVLSANGIATDAKR